MRENSFPAISVFIISRKSIIREKGVLQIGIFTGVIIRSLNHAQFHINNLLCLLPVTYLLSQSGTNFCEQKGFMSSGRIIKTATKLIMILRAKKENESKIEDKKMWRKTRTQCSNSPKHLCTTHLFLLRQSVANARK